MKNLAILSAFSLLALTSCHNSRSKENHKQETPKALDDKSSNEIFSKRVHDDLIESLYNELADKSPELKDLENKIERITKSKSDSTESFDKYNAKNQEYFTSANRHIDQIKDSILRDKIKTLISNSLIKYNSKILRHINLLNSIDTRTATLNDLHTILKIIKTLPLIEKYQTDNIPTTKSLDGYSRQLDETIKYADTLTKK